MWVSSWERVDDGAPSETRFDSYLETAIGPPCSNGTLAGAVGNVLVSHDENGEKEKDSLSVSIVGGREKVVCPTDPRVWVGHLMSIAVVVDGPVRAEEIEWCSLQVSVVTTCVSVDMDEVWALPTTGDMHGSVHAVTNMQLSRSGLGTMSVRDGAKTGTTEVEKVVGTSPVEDLDVVKQVVVHEGCQNLARIVVVYGSTDVATDLQEMRKYSTTVPLTSRAKEWNDEED